MLQVWSFHCPHSAQAVFRVVQRIGILADLLPDLAHFLSGAVRKHQDAARHRQQSHALVPVHLRHLHMARQAMVDPVLVFMDQR